jgi:hypothetical protein
MFQFVVMPSHLHLFCPTADASPPGPNGEGRLKGTLEQFKRWTGHRAGEVIDLGDGRFWQDEWFDHWSRSDEEDERIVAYIRHNPVKADLVKNHLEWPYGSWNEVIGPARLAGPTDILPSQPQR